MGTYKEYVQELFEAAQDGDRDAARAIVREGGCPFCFGSERTYGWRGFSNGKSAIEVRCAECHHFLKWAPQTPEFVSLAARQAQAGPRQEAS